MASNKNQHFVPRCYLRPFTWNEEGKTINLFNVDRKALILRAPVKTQCSRNYFYGKDEKWESGIQALESLYSSALKEVRSARFVLSQDVNAVLLAFCLLQNRRTEAASMRVVAMNNAMGEAAGIEGVTGFEDFKMNRDDAVEMALSHIHELSRQVADLKTCLVKNRTSVPFLTSDDPAIHSNRWHLQSPLCKGRSFGVANSGCIFLMPLTPSILFLAYDGNVYSVARQDGWASMRCTPRDVEAINEHQLLNCYANLYVDPSVSEESIARWLYTCHERRPAEKCVVHYAIFDAQEGETTRYKVVSRADAPDHRQALIHLQVVHPNPTRWPTLLGWRRDGFAFSNGSGMGYLREPKTFIGKGGVPRRVKTFLNLA